MLQHPLVSGQLSALSQDVLGPGSASSEIPFETIQCTVV